MVSQWTTYGSQGLGIDPARREARELTTFLCNIRFTRVLTIRLLRARQTCDLAGLRPRSEIEPDLSEWSYGDYEGMSTADIRKSQPH